MTQLQQFEYFYDKQQVRFLEQIVRAFSGWGYMPGSIAGQQPVLQIVPCRMATTNRVVGNILRNQSENTLLTTPMITIWQTGLTINTDALQNRNHIDTRQVVERGIDPNTGDYTSVRGQGYTVQRLMPIPFNMNLQVDLWTSNLDQKYQLVEQILTTMCPSFDIQNSDNALDWTALTTVYFEEINLSSRTIPVGTTDDIDVTSFVLRLPIWLSPPAKVTQQRLIEQIITNMNDETTMPNVGVILDSDPTGNLIQSIVTPGNYSIEVSGSEISLLGDSGLPIPWQSLLDQYGVLRPAVSLLALITTSDINGPQIVGNLQATSDPTKLSWQIDPSTLPANTLDPINAVIDPLKSFPIQGGLPAPSDGDRYLLLSDIGPSVAWGTITAHYGDIIQYSAGTWVVSFTAAGSGQQYVLNQHSGSQLRWTGDDWVLAIDGKYAPGHWRLWL